MQNCEGPCLKHCYSRYNYVYTVIFGIVTFIFGIIFANNYNKRKHEENLYRKSFMDFQRECEK